MSAALEAFELAYETPDGVRLVGPLSLAIEPATLVAVVGPNGAGKTTLLNLLGGELKPTSGRVELGGVDSAGRPAIELAAERAVLPQHTILQFAFTCLDVVMMGRYHHRDPGTEVVQAAMAATDTNELELRTYPSLSGGEQTRVSIARVFAQETPVLLLDEPTASLDLRHQELVMRTLQGLAKEGKTVLTVMHDLNLAARYADRVVLLDGGTVHADGAVDDVLTADVIQAVYHHSVRVLPHPQSGRPVIVPAD